MIHLWTGLRICTRLLSWCGAPIIVIEDQLTNATDAPEIVTCAMCLAKLAEAQRALPRDKDRRTDPNECHRPAS